MYQSAEVITGIFFIKRGKVAFVMSQLMKDSPVFMEYQDCSIVGFEDLVWHELI